MISHDVKNMLLFIEPSRPAADVPVVDDLTRKMTAAFRAATTPHRSFLGLHVCVCGACSDTRNFVLPGGRLTNSLCVHYLAYHRDEVPPEHLHEVAQLASGECDPTDRELMGARLRTE